MQDILHLPTWEYWASNEPEIGNNSICFYAIILEVRYPLWCNLDTCFSYMS